MVENSSKYYSFNMSVNLSHLFIVSYPVIRYSIFSMVQIRPSYFSSSSFSMINSFSSLSSYPIWSSFRAIMLLWLSSIVLVLLISSSTLVLCLFYFFFHLLFYFIILLHQLSFLSFQLVYDFIHFILIVIHFLFMYFAFFQ